MKKQTIILSILSLVILTSIYSAKTISTAEFFHPNNFYQKCHHRDAELPNQEPDYLGTVAKGLNCADLYDEQNEVVEESHFKSAKDLDIHDPTCEFTSGPVLGGI